MTLCLELLAWKRFDHSCFLYGGAFSLVFFIVIVFWVFIFILKLQEMDDDDDDDEERMTNGDLSRDLRNDEDDLRDPVDVSQPKLKRSDKFKVSSFKERLTLAEKNERLQSQLRSLKEDLANTRDDQVRARQSADIS